MATRTINEITKTDTMGKQLNITRLQNAKIIIQDAINELEQLKNQNNQLKGILYRSILKNGSKLSDRPLEQYEIDDLQFRVSKEDDGEFVVVVYNQKTLKK
jgi:ribosomal protein L14E/L6E/L27E